MEAKKTTMASYLEMITKKVELVTHSPPPLFRAYGAEMAAFIWSKVVFV
jgi:hypothetical protein